MEAAATQLGDQEFHNWLKVGLAIRVTTDGLLPFCERHGRAFYNELIEKWKEIPTERGEPKWTDADRQAIKCTAAGSDAGTQYLSSSASKQREDFAEAIKRRHINSVDNIRGTDVPVNKAVPSDNFKIKDHCDASRWGDDDAWFEVFKAYIKMRLGPHSECIQKTKPSHLDICGLTAGMGFCDGFTHCIDQRTKSLPEGHRLRVAGNPEEPSGRLEAARNVRNGVWGHVRSLKLSDEEATRAIATLKECLLDNTGGSDALLHDQQAKDAAAELDGLSTLSLSQLREKEPALRQEHLGAVEDAVKEAVGERDKQLMQEWLHKLREELAPAGQALEHVAHRLATQEYLKEQEENLKIRHEEEQCELKLRQLDEMKRMRVNSTQPALQISEPAPITCRPEVDALIAEYECMNIATSETIPSIGSLYEATGATPLEGKKSPDKKVLALFCTADGAPNVEPELQKLAEQMNVPLPDAALIRLRGEKAHISRNGNCLVLWQAEPCELRKGLLEFDPHVLHVAGHSSQKDGSRMLSSSYDEDSLFRLISSTGFANRECIVLNMCQSMGLGLRLLKAGCPHVVAWEGNTTDKACSCFSEAFYQGLRHCRNFYDCFEIGSAAVAAESKSNTFVVDNTTNHIRCVPAPDNPHMHCEPVLLPSSSDDASQKQEGLLVPDTAELKQEVRITLNGDCGDKQMAVLNTFQQYMERKVPSGEFFGLPEPSRATFFIIWEGDLSKIRNAHTFLDRFEEHLKAVGVDVFIDGIDQGSIVMLVNGPWQSYQKAQRETLSWCNGFRRQQVELRSVTFVVASIEEARCLEQQVLEVFQGARPVIVRGKRKAEADQGGERPDNKRTLVDDLLDDLFRPEEDEPAPNNQGMDDVDSSDQLDDEQYAAVYDPNLTDASIHTSGSEKEESHEESEDLF